MHMIKNQHFLSENSNSNCGVEVAVKNNSNSGIFENKINSRKMEIDHEFFKKLVDIGILE